MNNDTQYKELVSKIHFIKNFMENESYEEYKDGSKNPKEYEIFLLGSIYPFKLRYNNIFAYIKNKSKIIFDIDLDYQTFDGEEIHSLIDYSEWGCIGINAEEFNSDILSMNDMELILRYGKLDLRWINYSHKYIDAIYKKFIQLSKEKNE